MASIDELRLKIAAGNNSLSAFSLYNEKIYYYNEIFPTSGLNWFEKPMDFNTNPLYGKINLKKQIIFPRTSRMRSIGKDVKVFDFVATAFEDLQNYIRRHTDAQWLTKEGKIAECAPKKGYVDIQKYFTFQSEAHYYVFVNNHLKNMAKRGKQVKNMSDFMNLFTEYSKISLGVSPFTNISVFKSSLLSPLSTGLCVEISDEPYDDDAIKHRFINHPNFSFYKIAARKHGFMIDRNVPWRLVADVNSFKMREYMRIVIEGNMMDVLEKGILQEAKHKLEEKMPKMPSLADIADMDKEQISESTWNYKDMEDIKNKALTDVEEAKEDLIQAQSLHWAYDYFHNSIDPVKNSDGEPDCNGKKCKSRVTLLSRFFDLYYYLPAETEISSIRERFFQYYQSYILQDPTFISNEPGCYKEIDRENILLENYYSRYDENFWFKVYLELRMSETNKPLNIKERNKHLSKIIKTKNFHRHNETDSLPNFQERKLDFLAAMQYIENMASDKFIKESNIYISNEVQTYIDLAIVLQSTYYGLL